MEINDIRVAKVLEPGKIVINKGSKDGITNSMEFLVYEIGEEIKDPVSGKSLGVLEDPKGTFRLIHVQENIAVLLTNIKRPSKLLPFMAFGEVNQEYEIMKTVKIGDLVKIINSLSLRI